MKKKHGTSLAKLFPLSLLLVCLVIPVAHADMGPKESLTVAEAGAYALLLREGDFTRRRAVGYAFAANIASYALTFLPLHPLYEPLTRL